MHPVADFRSCQCHSSDHVTVPRDATPTHAGRTVLSFILSDLTGPQALLHRRPSLCQRRVSSNRLFSALDGESQSDQSQVGAPHPCPEMKLAVKQLEIVIAQSSGGLCSVAGFSSLVHVWVSTRSNPADYPSRNAPVPWALLAENRNPGHASISLQASIQVERV